MNDTFTWTYFILCMIMFCSGYLFRIATHDINIEETENNATEREEK